MLKQTSFKEHRCMIFLCDKTIVFQIFKIWTKFWKTSIHILYLFIQILTCVVLITLLKLKLTSLTKQLFFRLSKFGPNFEKQTSTFLYQHWPWHFAPLTTIKNLPKILFDFNAKKMTGIFQGTKNNNTNSACFIITIHLFSFMKRGSFSYYKKNIISSSNCWPPA